MAEKKKGGAGKKVAAGVGTVGVLGAAAYLLTHCGAGLGFIGNGNGSGDSSSQGSGNESSVVQDVDTTAPVTTTSQSTAETTTTAAIPAVEVTVNGNDYFYENHSYSLDDLMAELKKLDAGTAVRITDENASLNAYNALISALDGAEISYLEVQN